MTPQNATGKAGFRRWILPDEPDRSVLHQLESELNIPEIVARILWNRNIRDFEEARGFLKPSLDELHDPFLMADMDKAVDRLEQAIDQRERTIIHGDYDVDGVVSTALMIRVLSRLGVPVSFYIPNRLREGYGVSEQGIRAAYEWGAKLMVSVDCGITACDEIKLSNSLGVDMIITDHHESTGPLPDALAILDPKREHCAYPFKQLAGVGIAFKLLQALFIKKGLDMGFLFKQLDMIALGSAADIVPLVDENRTLVKFGIERMHHTENLGLIALLDKVGLNGKSLGTGQLVFVLAPRINAVGRMGSAQKAVRMLTTDSEGQARNIAEILEAENRKRKEIDDQTFEEAVEMVGETVDLSQDSAIVLASEGWHPGVIGIVASRVVEKFYLPTVMITLEGDIGRGSARSITGFDLYRALCVCGDTLTAFGGHKYAAGLTIERKNVDRFREALQKVADEQIPKENRVPFLKIDGEIDLADIDHKLVGLLGYLAPFGPQNMRPVLVSKGLEVVGTPAIVGNNHLKFKARQSGKVFDCIGFSMGDLLYRAVPNEPNLDLAYVVEENDWGGRTRIQLRIKDLR